MALNLRPSEIEQFLCDVRDHFRASLESSEYENTSNVFFVTAAESTEKLLERCEQLLEQCSTNKISQPKVNGAPMKLSNGIADSKSRLPEVSNGPKALSTNTVQRYEEDASYLDMSANIKKKATSMEFIDYNKSIDSDKTFRCSTTIMNNQFVSDSRNRRSNTVDSDESETELDVDDNDDGQIYDICLVAQTDDAEESQKAITPDLDLTSPIDCPYADLSAGHLAIQKSPKFGHLQRIEKRLFFDQSKKYYCGILNDWLLCYADGPTAGKPILTLYLRGNGVEIEHSGEGKRRDICFQITTGDPSKKYVFQANNEVDAKEWIHATEAAIRGDAALKNARKLPTPPVMKKMTFMGNKTTGSDKSLSNDYIYEEPSPVYNLQTLGEMLSSKTSLDKVAATKPNELYDELSDSRAVAQKFEYDVPKCPAKPLNTDTPLTECESIGLLNINDPATNMISNSLPPTRSAEKLNFQSKIKDVHNKLSSQLSVGTHTERLKKSGKKTYSCCLNEAEDINFVNNKEQKKKDKDKDKEKDKKSMTPVASPQKNNNNNNSTALSPNGEKSAKNWFLNRLNKTTSSTRNSSLISPTKCKQSEKENLLNSLEMCENFEGSECQHNSSGGSNPASPILKSHPSAVATNSGGGSCKSKVNMIINQFEAGGHLAMYGVETVAGNAVASLTSFCDGDYNNYEPIMTVSTSTSSFMKS